MMQGTTQRRRATLPITFRLPGQPDLMLEFVIDTGFTEYLTLIVWEGRERQVSVLATSRRPLLGTALLDDQDLYVRFREGGSLTITGIDDVI